MKTKTNLVKKITTLNKRIEKTNLLLDKNMLLLNLDFSERLKIAVNEWEKIITGRMYSMETSFQLITPEEKQFLTELLIRIKADVMIITQINNRSRKKQ